MRKSAVLEIAILGLLRDASLHGYELRKRLTTLLGALRAISFGALYPALRTLTEDGFIQQLDAPAELAEAITTKRARITYAITEAGLARLTELLSDSGPETWDDEGFEVRFVFFAWTEAVVRRRILEGRRARLAERQAKLSANLKSPIRKSDDYSSEMRQHLLDFVENELRWIEKIIAQEDLTTKAAQ